MIETRKEWWVRQLWNLVPYLVTAALGLLAPLVLVMDSAETGEHYWPGFYLVAFGAVILRVSAFFVEKAKGWRRALKQSSSIIRVLFVLVLGTWALAAPARAWIGKQVTGRNFAVVYNRMVPDEGKILTVFCGDSNPGCGRAYRPQETTLFFPTAAEAIRFLNEEEISEDDLVGVYELGQAVPVKARREVINPDCSPVPPYESTVWKAAE